MLKNIEEDKINGGLPMVIREYEGRTEREAIKKAVEDLGVESDKLKIEVISSKSRFFSFGNTVRVRVYLEDEGNQIVKKVEDFLRELFNKIDIPVEFRGYEEDDKIYIEIISDNAGVIIGKRGKTLEALQLLINVIVSKEYSRAKRIILDIENYRDKRRDTLKDLAIKVADKVKKTGKAQLLEPMNPFERRVIHMTLQNDPDVDTKSEGIGNLKKIKIFPKRKKSK